MVVLYDREMVEPVMWLEVDRLSAKGNGHRIFDRRGCSF